MTQLPSSLRGAAERWLADDPDPQTRAELEALLAAGPVAELRDAFDGSLQFGTAGLRGRLGPGPNRMNRAVVRRTAAGLAAWLGIGRVVIGYDARHRSEDFAHDAAAVLAGAGLEPLLLPNPLPTPVLAFAVRHLHCAAGLMVTASHNPAQDNGLKVYLADGSQIAPPADEQIAAAIARVGSVADVPIRDAYEMLGQEVLEDYLRAATAVVEPGSRDLSLVTTALHGVGGAVLHRALVGAGFPSPETVASQFAPDPDFPTVAFPNPEEPGALDEALALASERGCDAVIAIDPDADRCAIALPGHDGYRMLTGDELGVLLGWWILERDRRAGRRTTGVFASTIVSSRLFAKVAAAADVPHVETLTGFKWIARVPNVRYGYEEAIGYCVAPWAVRDKDGITAALLASEMLAMLRAEGRGAREVLADLARLHGLHATRQWSRRASDLGRLRRAMQRVRAHPPATLAGSPVTEVTDFVNGATGLAPTDAVRWLAADGSRVVVRPSGTEPKLKCYLEVIEEMAAGPGAPDRAEDHLDSLEAVVATLTGLE